MMSDKEIQAFGKVAVLMGGHSAEREVSLRSGQAVLQALLRCGVDAQGIDVGQDILTVLQQASFDRAFIALHGRGGEDGVLQGALEVMGLPYTGSGVLGCALGMDKLATKHVWGGAGLPTPDYLLLEPGFDAEEVAAHLGFPCIVKPALEGSSVGITKVERLAHFARAYQEASVCGGPVFAERWIDGVELTAAVLGDQALPIIRLETPHAFYDYEAKYHSSTTQYHCPAGLPAAQEASLRALAHKAFKITGGSGWGRVDLMLDAKGQSWLIEINSVPGMTDHSLVPMAAKAAGIDFDTLVLQILASSVAKT
ncbi:D-alanine--D-alanine ligase [Thiorhodospira sibirica]|uniref:D-alanine--D-alanine ligase n=1 Tax=Thiorhodospira sibirica TaxID=154347 RepID=UPI0005943B19|nr:D-alanine--D-alanine ligase [Thiorhodospira sibirica]